MNLRTTAALLLVSGTALVAGGCHQAIRPGEGEQTAISAPEGSRPSVEVGSLSSVEVSDQALAPQATVAPMVKSGGDGPHYDSAGEAEPAAVATPLPETLGASSGLGRKIIKDGAITIEVKDLAQAISRLETTAVQLGGYVLETRTYGEESDRAGATIRFAVPADRFETALQRVRQLATRLLATEVSGVDVTQEYVDLQSEIANLEVTQARLRKLMEDARTVEEALQVNAQLMTIEGEIAQRKGRLQYLGQRSAFSTISVELVGPKPEATVTPTPTPVPAWQPGPIVEDSMATLRVLLQGLATVLIRMLIVLLPLGILIGVPLAVVWWLIKRLRRPSRSQGS